MAVNYRLIEHTMFRIFRKHQKVHEIDPDEIFLDAKNLPEFNVHQFEGRIERPITKRAVVLLGMAGILISLIFIGRIADLQILQGDVYRARAENNRLKHTPIFAPRGIIYDRTGTELAWNEQGEGDFPKRTYRDLAGLAHVLGYVAYPKKDSSGFYFQEDFVPKDGVELMYNDTLSGTRGLKITEVDVFGEVQSESTIELPKDGQNITLSVDARVQNELYKNMSSLAGEVGFAGGAAVIMDVETGEILALSSFPEYDPNVLTGGSDKKTIGKYLADKGTPFLNRAVGGLYAPGSTVKPFFGIAALNEGIITPEKQILSTGSISIPNPYFPELPTVFKDWKAHGWVDIRRALAVSSDVYFYEIGGGYGDQRGLGIARLEDYARRFYLGALTNVDLPREVGGVIPNPEWKKENFNGEKWLIGNTYHTAIGQYGFQVTPIELARAVAVVATGGKAVEPRVLLRIGDENAKTHIVSEDTTIAKENFRIVREGMRLGVTEGIAQALNVPYVEIAAKTGTAEIGSGKKLVHSWISGFFPYDHPRYSFVVIMSDGPRSNLKGAVFVMRGLFDWMAVNAKEYLE